MRTDTGVQGSSARRRGRPRLPTERVKQISLGLKVSTELHQKIVEGARRSGRSISGEVQHRVEEAYAGEERYGGARCAAVLRRLATAAATVEARYQTSPFDDQLAFKGLRRSWTLVIDDEAPWKEPVVLGGMPVLWCEPGQPPRRREVIVTMRPVVIRRTEETAAALGSLVKISPANMSERLKLIVNATVGSEPEEVPPSEEEQP
jgi:hypothetical protein